VGGAGRGPGPAAPGTGGAAEQAEPARTAGGCSMSHPSPVERPGNPRNPRAFFDVDIGGERGGRGGGAGAERSGRA